MRWVVRSMVALAIVTACGIFAGPACGSAGPAPESSAPKWSGEGIPAEITGSRVNIRCGAGTRFEIAGTVRKGQAVRVFSQANGWYEISMPGASVCWVAKRVITPERAVTARAKARPVAAIVRSESIYVRAAGNLKAKVLVEVPRGGKIEIVGQLGDWYKVRPPAAARAWVYGEYVRLRPERIGTIREQAVSRKGERPAPALVVDPAIQAAYQKAEAAYLNASAAGPLVGDFAGPLRLYQQIAADRRAPAALREHCRKRISQIARVMPLSRKRHFQSEQQKRFVQKMRRIQERFAAQKVAEPERAFDAKGTVYRLAGRSRPATHRLKVGDITLYLLTSKSVDLEKFVGKRVGVAGRFRKTPAGWHGAASEIIEVKEIEALQ